jgi:hypothetical protein
MRRRRSHFVMGQVQRQPVHAVFRGDDTSLSIAPDKARKMGTQVPGLKKKRADLAISP